MPGGGFKPESHQAHLCNSNHIFVCSSWAKAGSLSGWTDYSLTECEAIWGKDDQRHSIRTRSTITQWTTASQSRHSGVITQSDRIIWLPQVHGKCGAFPISANLSHIWLTLSDRSLWNSLFCVEKGLVFSVLLWSWMLMECYRASCHSNRMPWVDMNTVIQHSWFRKLSNITWTRIWSFCLSVLHC